ncbi:MAG TPA: DUF2652 domain-containing protein [Anaerolineales bacterium]|nr:DUF2652 domain-containing protein [Anaerolineales bacterium]
MTVYNGYLLIADISGYTGYLTQSEMDHANPIIQSLLEALVSQVGEPMHLWRMEGDAVLAYSTMDGFPSGETFLLICENLYQAFAVRRLDIIQNTTCTCRACVNVKNLDLKIVAHYGQFEQMKVGPMTDISGADVILVHRMAKTDVKQVTGVQSYALFSQPAYEAMGIQIPLLGYETRFEHFGNVSMRVYDLAKAWEKHRAMEAVLRVDEDVVYSFRHALPVGPAVAWEFLTSPELKRRWMEMISMNVENDGRMGLGTRYHCIHEQASFRFRITDWRPFRYFSTQFQDPFNPHLGHAETYELIPTENGVELYYRMAPLMDDDGTRHVKEEESLINVYKEFWPHVLSLLDEMVNDRFKGHA